MSCWDREFRTPLARRRWTWPPTCPRCASKYDYLAKSCTLYSADYTYNENNGDPANKIFANERNTNFDGWTIRRIYAERTCPSTNNNLNGSLCGCNNATTSYNSAPDIWLGSFSRAGWPNNVTLFWLLLPSAILSTRYTNGTFSNLFDEKLVVISRLVTGNRENNLRIDYMLFYSSSLPRIRFHINLFDGD